MMILLGGTVLIISIYPPRLMDGINLFLLYSHSLYLNICSLRLSTCVSEE